MSDDQFTRLFKHMHAEFAALRQEMHTEFARVHADIDRIYGLLDSVIKKQETDDQERLAIGHQVARHEAWIDRAAPVVKVTYTKT